MIKYIYFDIIGTLLDWHGSLQKKFHFIKDEWVKYYVEGEVKTSEDMYLKGRSLICNKDLCYLWNNLDFYPDVLDNIPKLREIVKVGLLTNCSKDILNNYKVDWDFVITAEEVGCKKPCPHMYEYAINYFDCDLSEILMVAAHKYDLVAAANAGMKTCYLYRPKEDAYPIDTDQFDYTVHNLDELISILISEEKV